jgi:hypothetical protein
MSLLNGYSRAKADLHEAERRQRAATAARRTRTHADDDDAAAKVSTTYGPSRPATDWHPTAPVSIRNIHAAIEAAYSKR